MPDKPNLPACCCALLIGASSLSAAAKLPSWELFAASLGGSLVMFRAPGFRLAAAFVAGLSLMGLSAAAALSDRLPVPLEGADLQFNARIDGFPRQHGQTVRFLVTPTDRPELPARIRLSWFEPASMPRTGDVWHLAVRLRRPAGHSNPAGFDFEKWALRERIGATGYVVAGPASYRVIGEPRRWLDRLRQRVVTRIGATIGDEGAAAVMMAIAVGARQGIGADAWEAFARTGTSHLMAISGLHVGLAALSAGVVLRVLLAPLVAHRNSRTMAAAGAGIAAAVYAGASGFAIPAQRALVMVLVAVCLVLFSRRLRPATILAVAFVAVFLSDPVSTLAPGFRLSFGAVAILFLQLCVHVPVHRFAGRPRLNRAARAGKRLLMLQAALLVGLFPLTIAEFQRVSIVAPVVNLLVMPVFSVVAVPCTLLGVILDGPLALLGDPLLRAAAVAVDGVMTFILHVAEFDAIAFRTAWPVPWFLLWLAPLGVLCPPGWPGRGIGLVCLLSAVSFRPAPPPHGCVDLHVLDVGQGLAVVARTRSETLLYDTGPSFRDGGSAAEQVVLPFLRSLGITHVDRIMLSHGDLDHAGGIRPLVDSIRVGEIIATVPGLGDITDRRCAAGVGWQADGVTFRVIHPESRSPWTGNNASCVIEIRAGPQSVLLPGDIEKPVELLIGHRRLWPKSTVVIVPHHGSRTSSSEVLVDATTPAVAIVSAGWRNRWGFPKSDVVSRWQQAGALVLDTAKDGAVSTRLCTGRIATVKRHRRSGRRYWHDDRTDRP